MDHSLPIDADPNPPASAVVAGRRPNPPQFTDDPMVDRLYGVTLSLVTELAVTRTRLDTLERLLERRGLLEQGTIESFKADDREAALQGRLQDEYLQRVLRALG